MEFDDCGSRRRNRSAHFIRINTERVVSSVSIFLVIDRMIDIWIQKKNNIRTKLPNTKTLKTKTTMC